MSSTEWVLAVAQEGPLRRAPMIDLSNLSEHFRHREPLIDPWTGLMALSAAVAIVTALALWRWWSRRAERSRPGWLLGEVRQAFGLERAEARLLRDVAAARDLPHPLALVLSRSTYRHHVDAFLAAAPSAVRHRVRLDRLEQTIFSAG